MYLIELELNKLGLHRDRTQTWEDWYIELRENADTSEILQGLQPTIEIHYRYCFDPQGITSEERAKLISECRLWLNKR